MARLTISVPDDLAQKAAENAEKQKRSTSSYVANLIETDLRAAGLLPMEADEAQAELMAKLQAEYASLPTNARAKFLAAASKLLESSRRVTRASSAAA